MFKRHAAEPKTAPHGKSAKVLAKVELDDNEASENSSTVAALIRRIEALELESEITNNKIRSLEDWANTSWKIPKSFPLSEKMWAHLTQYKSIQEPGKAHPDGPARICIIRGIVEWAESAKADDMEWQPFLAFHQKLANKSRSLEILYKESLQFGTLKEIKEEDNLLLVIRPYMTASPSYEPLVAFLDSTGTKLTGEAPPAGSIRQIRKRNKGTRARMNKNSKSAGVA